MTASVILIIEDDEIVARTIARSLGERYQVHIAYRGAQGLLLARQLDPDLVILDVLMPEMDGYTVCREMRSSSKLAHIPVLFLTARARDVDRIHGFTVGADDYLSKPFNLDELQLRVQAILRRTQPRHPLARGKHQGTLSVEGYTLHARTFEVETPHNGMIRLTPVQFDLLYHLMTHPGETFTPARLLDEIWDYPIDGGSPDLVRVHIKTLRERVEPNPRSPSFIRTIPGYGYVVGLRTSRGAE